MPDLDQRNGSEVGAGVAAAMLPVIGLLVLEPRPAELILITLPARFEQLCFGNSPPHRHGGPVYVRTANPDAPESRACGPNVEVHLPARAHTIRLVGASDRFDHVAAHRITEIRKTIE